MNTFTREALAQSIQAQARSFGSEQHSVSADYQVMKQPGVADRIGAVHGDVHELAMRLAKLRERLVGAAPSADEAKVSPGPSSGVLNELASAADGARQRLREAMADIEAIERLL